MNYALKPKVSIVCAWYNRPSRISTTLDSLLEQDFDDYEVIVLNDGSSDGLVRSILDEYRSPKLRVIHQENTGFTIAIQNAIGAAKGDFICVMGAGDVAEKSKTRVQYNYMVDRPNVVALGCGHYLFSSESLEHCGYYEPELILKEDVLRRRAPFTQGTVMYRADALRKVGGYDPYFKYCQDWDLYWRLMGVGEIHGIDQPLYRKLVFDDGASFSPDKKFVQYEFSRIAKRGLGSSWLEKRKETRSLFRIRDNRLFMYLAISIKMAIFFIKAKEFEYACRWIFVGLTVPFGRIHRKVDDEIEAHFKKVKNYSRKI